METSINHTAKPGFSTGESLLNTVYWLVFFLFIVPGLAHFLVVLVGLLTVPAANQAAEEASLLSSPVYWAVSGSVAAALHCGFVKYPLHARDKATTFNRLGFAPLRVKPLLFTLLIACGYMALETLVMQLAGTDEPAFLLELAEQMDSLTNIVMLFLAVVIIAPVVEETIFRGVAFYRLKNTRLGVAGAIIAPSIIFTLVHAQYEQISVFALLFLSSIMLGVIRHITNNLWYCIWAHMLMNLLVMGELTVNL